RFLIFHYILFKDRGSRVSELVSELPASEMPGARARAESAAYIPSTARDGAASEPFAAAGSAAGVNASPAWSGNAAARAPGARPRTAGPGRSRAPGGDVRATRCRTRQRRT